MLGQRDDDDHAAPHERKRIMTIKKAISPIAILPLLICLILSGCGRETLPDTYLEGSDFQYMYKYQFTSNIQKGPAGYYLLHDNYLYFLDEEAETIVPLCNKADCLHDRETDPERYADCNAYVKGTANDVGIAYCNGYLYWIERSFFSGEESILYRLSEDGAKREVICRWPADNTLLEGWIVHRDVLYYVEHKFEQDGDEMRVWYALKSLPLTGPWHRPRTIFEPEDDLDVASLAHPEAYGNYLYFQLHAYKKTEEEITDDNYLEYVYMKTFVYDMRNGQVKEITPPNGGQHRYVQGTKFWQGKIIFNTYNADKELTEPEDWYIAELDGSNAQVFMKDIPQGEWLFSDGRYLYRSNKSLVERGIVQQENPYLVYDEDLEAIDSFRFPFQIYLDPPIGAADRMYIQYRGEEDDGTWGVRYWDKSVIGRCGGSTVEMKEIPYRDS